MSRKYILLPCLATLLIAAVTYVAYWHGAAFPVLAPAGPVALQERWIMVITVLLCAIIVVPVFVLLFYFGWKYRADSPRAVIHHQPDWDHDSRAVEFSWWLLPTAIIAVLGIVLWQSAHALDPYKPLPGTTQPLTVQVVALDWKWLFIYPAQGIATVNRLEIPQGVPIHFVLTADAPMNSFWVPALGGQIMVMPGMQTQLNLLASAAGTYSGFSGNISGEGFSGMAFTVDAVAPDAFSAWVASAQASTSTPLDAAHYATLAAPSEYNAAALYAPVDPSLYESVIMGYMMPSTTTTSSDGAMMMP